VTKYRLDHELLKRSMVSTRSQAESYIKLGLVLVNKKPVTKPGFFVGAEASIELKQKEQYVSRAGLKLESVAKDLDLSFKNKVVLDVGSSTGGFTDFAIKNGAKKVIAVDVGSDQLHPSLRNNEKIELHEKTDIRDFITDQVIDVVVIDVSFISLREILPAVAKLVNTKTVIAAMCKPQFEAGSEGRHSGVVKNDSLRRAILKDFEIWVKRQFVVLKKADSKIAGAKGNKERFYLLKKV